MPYSGTVRYGEPVRAQLVISATQSADGYASRVVFGGGRPCGRQPNGGSCGAALEVVPHAGVVSSYLPAMGEAWYGTPAPPFVSYAWERPDGLGRRDVPLLKRQQHGVTLPVTITVGSR